MKMIDWVRDFLNEPPAEDATAEVMQRALEGLKSEQAEGLNFKTAIDAHMKWKGRLTRYVAGTSEEKLDASVVSQDDQCALGTWIHGAGRANYGTDKLFNELKSTHANFHRCAGKIVTETDNGNRGNAGNMLHEGEYPRASSEVTRLLAQLYVKFQKK